MNTEDLFIHKLEGIFDSEITASYQDETGYFIKINGEWKKLNLSDKKPPKEYLEV